MRRKHRQVLSGFLPLGSIRRIEIEPPKPVETPTERRQREWRESCERETKRVQAARTANIEAERTERLRERAERDKVNKCAAFDSAEFQITAVFDQYQLDESERASIEDAITQRQLWATPMKAVEFATVSAMEIAAKREQANQRRLAEVRSLCDDDEWERILSTIARYRHHFTEAEIASGEAHRIVHNRFRE